MKSTIICVDDEQLILIAIKEQLESRLQNEYYIETAESAEEALEIFNDLKSENTDVPLIISDYLMPGMKGDEFLIKIHTIAPETRKIMLTGQARLEGVTNAVNKADLYRYIEKPWDAEDLLLTVKEAVKSFYQQKKIAEYTRQLEQMNINLEEKVRQRTKELREANATKDKFFSIIAHDLKNPFTALTGYSSMLISEYNSFEDEERLELLNSMFEASESTLSLLNNLLEWSRSQQGLIERENNLFNLKQLTEESIAAYRANAKDKNITLTIDVPGDINIYSDYFMINTVIRNLVSNAIKFTNDGGKIEVAASQKEEEYLVSVSDNGTGMDDETAANLFRIDKGISKKGTNNETGSGLGLILCKEFITKVDGRIWVESKPGKGTTISFTIPVVDIREELAKEKSRNK